MGLFDGYQFYPQASGGGLLDMLMPSNPGQYNYQGKPDDWKQGWPEYVPPPPMYSEPHGDPSGSQPYTRAPDPYNLSGIMPRQTNDVVVDTGSYSPKPQEAPAQDRPLFRPGSPLAKLAEMFSGSGTAQPPPQQNPAFGSGAQPFPFANMVPSGAAQPPQPTVPLPTPRPQMAQDQPTSTYAHGGVQVPVFGQPEQAAIPQQAQPAQYQQTQQEAGGNSFMAGLQGFAEGGRSGGLIGALTGGVNGFSSGATRENQTVKALVASGLDPVMAQTVAKDPQLLRAILPNLMGNNLKPSFGVIGEDQFGNKQYGWIDPKTLTTMPGGGANASAGGATVGGAGSAGFVTGPDGKPIAIPPGVDPKEFRKKVSDATADAAVGKRTEVQQKADQFASRMELAEKNVKGLEGEGVGASGAWNAVAGEVPIIGATMQSDKFQKFEQAKRQFITALLRQESGAAIGKSEFDRYDKEFFPQPGNSPEIIAQKREARRVAIDAMRRGAGPGGPAVGAGPSGVTTAGVKWSIQ